VTAPEAGSTERPLRVRVAILTYKRPDTLRGLLEALGPHLDAVAGDERWHAEVDVLVVDNDAAGSGRAALLDPAPFPLSYVVEPEPGIAAARDRVLAESTGIDLLAFIDDDELPGPTWLAPMVGLWSTARPAAVVGHVVPQFAEQPDPFVEAGGFFVRPSHATGAAVGSAACNNLLLDLAQVRAHGLTFDRSLGLRGGEDTLFTRRLVAAGGVILWCQESTVLDLVPADRATREWVLKRRYSHASTLSLVQVALAPSTGSRLAVRARATAAGSALVLGGLLRAGYGAAMHDVNHRALGLRSTYRGAGRVAGAFGASYREYARA
jgi:glycosyltransferase involved in cell wall biosynthesis